MLDKIFLHLNMALESEGEALTGMGLLGESAVRVAQWEYEGVESAG